MEKLKRLSLYIFYGLLAYMPFHILLSTWIGSSFGILEAAKISKDIILVVGFVLAGIAGYKAKILKPLFQDKLILLISAYAALNVLLALLRSTDVDAEILGLVYNTRFLLFFIYAVLLSRLFPSNKLFSRSTYLVLVVTALVALFGIMQYTVLPNDALTSVGYSRENGVLPAFFIDDKPDLERVMSTLRDPNSLGSYLIIGGMLTIAYVATSKTKDERYRYGSLLLSIALCLWFTFSRSALLGFMVAALAFGILKIRKMQPVYVKYKEFIVIGCVSLIAIVSVGLAVTWNSYTVQNVLFHADQNTTLEDPNELRVRFWRESAEEIAADALGSGPGTAGLASIRNDVQGTELNENYYLQIGSELGILGLLLFMAIISVVTYRLYLLRADPYALALLASFAGLALTNFLVHIWSNEAVAYTWWGLAGLVIYLPVRNSHNKK